MNKLIIKKPIRIEKLFTQIEENLIRIENPEEFSIVNIQNLIEIVKDEIEELDLFIESMEPEVKKYEYGRRRSRLKTRLLKAKLSE